MNSNHGGPYIVFEVGYLWNSSVKKDGVDANLIQCYDCPNFKYGTSVNFAFNSRLSAIWELLLAEMLI